jgi:type II secretory ATPase GspE/PulE/Tfp pilus assembly ATPase PilB-like protein
MTSELKNRFLQWGLEAGNKDSTTFGQCMDQASRKNQSPVEAVLEARLVEETSFLEIVARELGFEWIPDPMVSLSPESLQAFPASLALKFQILPIAHENGEWHILTFDPLHPLAATTVAASIDDPVHWSMSSRAGILETLKQTYGIGAETFEQILEGRNPDDVLSHSLQEINVLDETDAEASVIKFVNQIIHEAIDYHATDIHVEPLEHDLRIRYRLDGMLQEIPVPANIKMLQSSVITRLKIMADLDIAERRLPQDGRISLELKGEPLDVRVATIPTIYGETVSLRILGQEKFNLARLNLEPPFDQQVVELLREPNGIVLLTGPTGCGKSTSLYTFLSQLNTNDRRIITIEDPVENKLPGVIQIAVKPDIDLTFAKGLRSVLRADPNVIMIGEMRDLETAEIAIRAALTGHLVFSTLHTNDAVGGITRLVDMGVEPFLVASSVRAFIAQRLVRTLCPHCKTPATPPRFELEKYHLVLPPEHQVHSPVGCPKCRQTGYSGRTAIYEICQVSAAVHNGITRGENANDLRALARQEGMLSLIEYGWIKILKGETTLEEVLMVAQHDTVQHPEPVTT